MRALLGLLLGLVARVWLGSLRARLVLDDSLETNDDAPWVLCFWHGTQFPLLSLRVRRPTVTLVSHSRDGAMQARALGVVGLNVVRGSSSRGGASGVRGLVRFVRSRGADAAFAVDGPRGPYGIVKNGAIVAAKLARGKLVPMGAAVARGHVFSRAWDRFLLPWPLSRVVIVAGRAIDPHGPDATGLLEREIARCNAIAARCLAGGPVPVGEVG